MENLIPIVGDHVIYLGCISCRSLEDCKEVYQRGNPVREDIRVHIKEGTVIQCTSSIFAVREHQGVFPNRCLVQIKRDIVQEAKVQETPDNIIRLDF